LKYHPGDPDRPYESIEKARGWVLGFAQWYNYVHRHSALKQARLPDLKPVEATSSYEVIVFQQEL
jgi:hypothetical protein